MSPHHFQIRILLTQVYLWHGLWMWIQREGRNQDLWLSNVSDLGQVGERHLRLEDSISQGWWWREKVSSRFNRMTLNFRHRNYWALVIRMKSVTAADHWPEAQELQCWSCFLVSLVKDLQVACHFGKVNRDFDLQCFLGQDEMFQRKFRCYLKMTFSSLKPEWQCSFCPV